ncbi:MAG: isochorismate synthase [Burkholderiaceae bacterium]
MPAILSDTPRNPSAEAATHCRDIGSPDRDDQGASQPLSDYSGAAFVFVSPTTSVMASAFAPDLQATDVLQAVDADRERNASDVLRAVNTLFERARHAGIAQPLLVGAVPFDVTQAPRLSIARQCRRTPRALAIATAGASMPMQGAGPGQVVSQTPQPSPAVFEAAVREALAHFEQGDLGKVVLSRTLKLALRDPLHLPSLMASLLAKNTHGYTYAVPLGRAGEVFLGASPELLVRRVGNRVMLNPLAGSAARRSDAREDQAAGQALMESDKDLKEHAIVIDAIASVLRPLCRTLNVPTRPSLVATDALWHLSTRIEGELIDPATTSLDLAFALHPTPAVCGYPTELARQAINRLEPFDRGFFAGFVGWMDAAGDGEWAVSLRCATCGPSEATLYAGAGIVPGSVPQRETAETQTKFRTMLSALGLGQSIEQR